MRKQAQAALQRLPKVDEVLKGSAAPLLAEAPRWAVLRAVREEIDRLRHELLTQDALSQQPTQQPMTQLDVPEGRLTVDVDRLRKAVRGLLRPSLFRVLNATGVVIHTNLGRAPLPEAALRRIVDVAGGYANLEYRLEQGERGSRHEHLGALLSPLTGAEAHIAVNNNAAAVLLLLSGLCAGKEVVVSRGELVEIGGSFRIPDILRASGALLREVGTTNRTHLRDYEGAISEDTAAFLKVHQSNFALVGFTAEVGLLELSRCAHERGVLSLCDLGSGALIDPGDFLGADVRTGQGPPLDLPPATGASPAEPTVAHAIAAGADVVTFSCDKLLGGPQAGILCGRADLIERLKKHPLMRALRPDKLTLLSLCATLELYRDRDPTTLPDIPVLSMLSMKEAALRARAEQLAALCQEAGVPVEVVRVRSAVGGGALPLSQPPSFAVSVSGRQVSVRLLEQSLRRGDPPVVARIADDCLLLDVRTLQKNELAAAGAALGIAFAQVAAAGATTTTAGDKIADDKGEARA